MANTTAKVNNYIALGYIYLASDSQIEGFSAPASQEITKEETPAIIDDVVNEPLLPINNSVLKTVNLSSSSSGMRI